METRVCVCARTHRNAAGMPLKCHVTLAPLLITPPAPLEKNICAHYRCCCHTHTHKHTRHKICRYIIYMYGYEYLANFYVENICPRKKPHVAAVITRPWLQVLLAGQGSTRDQSPIYTGLLLYSLWGHFLLCLL